METRVCCVRYLILPLTFANMILVLATSRGVVTAAAKPPVHINTHKRGTIYHAAWHFIIFIPEFLATLPKILLYRYIHLTDSRTGRTHATSLPTRSAAITEVTGQRFIHSSFFKKGPTTYPALLWSSAQTFGCMWGICGQPPPLSERHCGTPWVSGSLCLSRAYVL